MDHRAMMAIPGATRTVITEDPSITMDTPPAAMDPSMMMARTMMTMLGMTTAMILDLMMHLHPPGITMMHLLPPGITIPDLRMMATVDHTMMNQTMMVQTITTDPGHVTMMDLDRVMMDPEPMMMDPAVLAMRRAARVLGWRGESEHMQLLMVIRQH